MTLQHVCMISRLCEIFESSLTYRAAFLLEFFGLLHISNIAHPPPFTKAFDPTKHILRRDISFLYPGTHIRLKWAKNIQAPERVHMLKLPCVDDSIMCPTQALRSLMAKKVVKPSDPLLVLDDFSLITHHLRHRLATFIRTTGLSIQGFGFHSFSRTGGHIDL